MAANPFMMDDINPVHQMGSGTINPFAIPTTTPAPSAVSNPFFDIAPANTSAASNPFLMDDIPQQPSGNAVYNPFASSVMESDPVSVNEHVDSLAWLSSGGAMQMQDNMASPYDLPDTSSLPHSHQLMDDLLEVDVPLPEELVADILEVATPSPRTSPIPESLSNAKPGRPAPPPRPPSRPSPPHETQQLILSVTGAMQATSEHLLDRLRATAPSPVPGYHPHMHSHSPSPSPSPCPSPTRHVELDLLHDDHLGDHLSDHLGDHLGEHQAGPPRPTSRPSSPAVPQRPQQLPARPTPPGPPPRPVAPTAVSSVQQPPPADKGFASIFGQPSPTSELEALAFSSVPDTTQPVVEAAPAEEIDLLGLPKPRTRTNNDILKLFEKKEEQNKDLLAGDVFENTFLVDLDHEAPPCPIAPESSFVLAPSTLQSSSLFEQEELVAQPTEVAQTVEEETLAMNYQPPQENPTLVYSEIKSPIMQSNPIAIPSSRGDNDQPEEFDAFSSRFESVGREDMLMVENDPFDPFSAGGSAKGSSGKQ